MWAIGQECSDLFWLCAREGRKSRNKKKKHIFCAMETMVYDMKGLVGL
jgi:hypothetical protein